MGKAFVSIKKGLEEAAEHQKGYVMEKLTSEEAYCAAFYFLKKYWDLTSSEGVGDLLSIMSVVADGMPADPALWEDWRVAVEQAKKKGVDGIRQKFV